MADRQMRDDREAHVQRPYNDRRAGVSGFRLGVNMSKLDFDRYAYRWINDAPARMHAKVVEEVWDVVMNDGSVKSDSADLGNAVSYVVGANKDGSPIRAYLCRKPKDYYDKDQRAKHAELDRQLVELRRGNDAAGVTQSDYVRDISIS